MPRLEQHPDVRVALNADIVNYTRLLADDFQATMVNVEQLRHLVDEMVTAGGGSLADFVGDNFMALFRDAHHAVRTAIDISAEIEARNSDLPEVSRARFRMGLDQGEVVVAGDRFLGDPLNIAARIQAMARPGGVSVSGRVYRALDEPALRFRSLGSHKLKNIPEQVDVFEFRDLPADGSAVLTRRPLSLGSPTVAVLPIHTETVDESIGPTAGVLRRDLIHRLTAVPELSVIDAKTERGDRASSVTARYILESGLHQVGPQVRLYMTLFDVTTMNIVKSHKWTARAEELFSLSEEFADEMARSLEIDLIVGEPAGLYANLEDPEAIERVYLGWYHLRTDTRQGWVQALELFGQVAESHPEQPFGHVLSAFANWLGASNGWVPDPSETLAMARRQAQTAAGNGDQTGMSMAVEAAVLMSQGKVEEALSAMEDLEIVRPTCDVTYGLEGSVRRYLGQWEQAVDRLDVAMRLTGINKPWYPTVKACSLFIGGRLEEAAAIAEEVVDFQPRNLEALAVLAAAQVELGLRRRALATGQIIRERFPAVDLETWIDQSPYQDEEVVERWKQDLRSAGAIDAT